MVYPECKTLEDPLTFQEHPMFVELGWNPGIKHLAWMYTHHFEPLVEYYYMLNRGIATAIFFIYVNVY